MGKYSCVLSILMLLQVSFACSAETTEQASTEFKSTIAGRWYPGDAVKLKTQIDGLFAKAEAQQLDDVIALILPHAGYQYSGITAASGLKSLKKKYKTVIVIGPTHSLPMRDVLAVPDYGQFETPLGKVQFDRSVIEKLLQNKIFRNIPEALPPEHSVQIEVPLLQAAMTDFKIVLVIAGQCSQETILEAGKILAGGVDDETLVVVSSDFVHYGTNYDYVPFKENIPEELKKLDMGAFEFISKLDAMGFMDYRSKTGATICGNVPIAILLAMLPKDSKVNLVKYATSGEMMGDYSNSVSYLSVAFQGKWNASTTEKMVDDKIKLSDEDKETLLAMARRTIESSFCKGKLAEPDSTLRISDAMKVKRASFVTLKKNHELRGCIGEIFPTQPLYKSVISKALSSAFEDPRFNPLEKRELEEIEIEISALTPPEEVPSYKDIRIGTDGVVLIKGSRRAVYLPQVAPEQGWTLEETLSNLAMKAGLPQDAWREGASFLTFQAEVFSEKQK